MFTRILTALPLIAGFLFALYMASATVWLGIMGFALFLAAMEWAGLARLNKGAAIVYAAILTLTGVAMALLLSDIGWVYLLSLAFWLSVPWLLGRGVSFQSVPLMLPLGALVLLPTYLAIVGLREQVPNLLLAIVGLVVVADSTAYFAGRRFGRHKLAPAISPGKTWEGVGGAWLGVSVYALALELIWPDAMAITLPMAVVVAWILLALSVVGDLLESWIKRQAGVKDSGNLLPGHGGILDRIDSLTAALPAAALLDMWMP